MEDNNMSGVNFWVSYIITFVFGMGFSILSRFTVKPVAMLGLGELLLEGCNILIVTAIFCEFKKNISSSSKKSSTSQEFKSEQLNGQDNKKNRYTEFKTNLYSKIKKLQGLTNKKSPKHVKTDECDKITDIKKNNDNELIEINIQPQKDKEPKTKNNYKNIFLSIGFALAILVVILWSTYRIFSIAKVKTINYFDYEPYQIIIFLLFPGICYIYLGIEKNRRKEEQNVLEKSILQIISIASIICALVIAIISVLGLKINIIIPIVIRATSIYINVSLVYNIVLSCIKGNLLENNHYSLVPWIRTEKQNILESDEVKKRFSVKSIWIIKYALSIFPSILLLIGTILLLSTTVFIVQPYEQGMVYRFGKLSDSSTVGQGMHFKLPWPIDKVDIYNVQRTNSMQIGYKSSTSKDFLWNQTHDGGEYCLLTGNGNELVSVNIKLEYRIGDLNSYVKNYAKAEDILSANTYQELMDRTVSTDLDGLLTVDRATLSESLLASINSACDSEQLGIKVIKVVIESIHPPVDTADSYQKVISASLDKQTAIIKANADADKVLIDAEKQKDVAINDANANQNKKISDAEKEMAVYYAAMDAYKINPNCFRLTKYLDTYEKIIKGNKVYVFSPGTQSSMSNFIMGNKNTAVLTEN